MGSPPKEHFRTIRHIKRYTNGLRLTLAPVAEEVDLIDFLAIELIRVFHPEVYLSIVNGKEMLAPQRMGFGDGIPGSQLRERTEAVCAKASPGFESSVRQLLRELFPELARAYASTTHGDGYYAEWRKTCRVCSPDVFDKFFLLAIPSGDVSEVEMAAFVAEIGNPESTTDAIRRALASGKARRLLERLEDFTGDIPVEHVPTLVKVLFALGDELRFKSRGMLDVLADMQVPRLLYQSVRRLESEEDRLALLLESVREGGALYTTVQEVSLGEPKSEGAEDQLITDHGRWMELRDAATARIREANDSGELWSLKDLPYVLFRWLEWTQEDGVREAVNAHTADDANLVAFASRFVSESHSHTMGDKVARVHRKISKKGLGCFLEVEAATARLERLAKGDSEASKVAAELVQLLKAKSEDPWED